MFGLGRSRIKLEPESELVIDSDRYSNDPINNCLHDDNRHRETQKEIDNFESLVGKENLENHISGWKLERELVIVDDHEVNHCAQSGNRLQVLKKENENFVSPTVLATTNKDNCETGGFKHEPELIIIDEHKPIPVIVYEKYPRVVLHNCLTTKLITELGQPSPRTENKTDNDVGNRILAEDEISLEEHCDRLENERSFQCYKCRKTFDNDNECRMHMFSLCISTKFPILRLMDCLKTYGDKVKQSIIGNAFEYECYICKKQTFDSKKSLSAHLLGSHPSKSTSIDTVVKVRPIEVYTSMVRPYACKYRNCTRKYKSKYDLAAHVVTHSGKREHVCTYPGCESSFFNAKAVRMHQRTHSNIRKFVCAHENCGKRFKSRGAVRSHEKIHNPNAKLHVCNYTNCDKAFLSKHKLIRHRLTHDKNRPRLFQCTYPRCGRSYALKEILNTHLIMHREEKTFACDKCDQKFKWKRSLTMHKLTHSGIKPFACDHQDCGKAFKTKPELITHKFTHSDKRRFKCPKCKRRFKTAGLLSFHRRVHSSEKPFVCECGSAYKSKPNLQRHQREKMHFPIQK